MNATLCKLNAKINDASAYKSITFLLANDKIFVKT